MVAEGVDSRGKAEESFRNLTLPENRPTKKDENYRYLSLKGVEFDRQPSCKDQDFSIPEKCRDYNLLMDSRSKRFQKRNLPEGIEVRECSGAGVESNLSEDLFSQLTQARWGSGVEIRIGKGQKVSDLLSLGQWFDETSAAFFHRVVIVLEEGAEARIHSEFLGNGMSNGRAPFHASLTEVLVEKGARLHFSEWHGFGSWVQSFPRVLIRAKKDAVVDWTLVRSGSGISQLRAELECCESGSEIKVKGAARGRSDQTMDFWITSRHLAPDTKSSMEYWTVMGEKARSVFNGNIVITPDAVRTDAYQRNRNMLLSKTAVIDTVPKLEIGTDDVKCAHGASVTPVNPEHLYYLQSRGISKADSERMLVDGFTEPVIAELPQEFAPRVREAMGQAESSS